LSYGRQYGQKPPDGGILQGFSLNFPSAISRLFVRQRRSRAATRNAPLANFEIGSSLLP